MPREYAIVGGEMNQIAEFFFLLRTAQSASDSVDKFDLHHGDQESVRAFSELQDEQRAAVVSLVDFVKVWGDAVVAALGWSRSERRGGGVDERPPSCRFDHLVCEHQNIPLPVHPVAAAGSGYVCLVTDAVYYVTLDMFQNEENRKEVLAEWDRRHKAVHRVATEKEIEAYRATRHKNVFGVTEK